MEFKKANLRDEFKKDKKIETPMAENHVEYIYWLENRIVTTEAVIADAVCSCCGKNTPEICGSCVSDIAQETGDAAYHSR